MPALPLEERRELVRTMEERLARLIPEHSPGRLLEEYREALQIGNSEKAAYLRQEISDEAAREAVEAEISEAFRIAWEPLTLELSDEIPIDLTTPLPLTLFMVSGDKVFLKEGSDSYVMVDCAAKAACRMTSPVFERLLALDSTQEGTFLFRERKGEEKYGERLWRAELSLEGAVFTANFDIRQWFEVEDGFNVETVLLASERDTDYFVLVKHAEGRFPAKVLRKRLAPKGTVQTLHLGDRKDLDIWRWGSYPDHFVVGAEAVMKHVNRNLSVLANLRATPNIYKFDNQNGYVYTVEDCFLTRRNLKLELTKSYEKAVTLGMFESGRVHGISFQTDTALIVLGDGIQAFYNLGNNKFSSKIRVGRVIPSSQDGKWYCFDYSSKDRKLWLRDITREIHTELEWREFFFPRENRKKMNKRMLWFHDRNNFRYRPEEWGPADPAPGPP